MRGGEVIKGPWDMPERESARIRRNNERAMASKADIHRKALLEPVGKEIVKEARAKAQWILDHVPAEVKTRADNEDDIAETIRKVPVNQIVSALLGASERILEEEPAGYAGLALAFLALAGD